MVFFYRRFVGNVVLASGSVANRVNGSRSRRKRDDRTRNGVLPPPWEIFTPFSRAPHGYYRGNERERVTGGVKKLVTDRVKQGSLKVAKTKSFFRCGGRTQLSRL